MAHVRTSLQRLISAVVPAADRRCSSSGGSRWGSGAGAAGRRARADEYTAISLAGAGARLRVGVIVVGRRPVCGALFGARPGAGLGARGVRAMAALVLFEPGDIRRRRAAGDRGVRGLLPGRCCPRRWRILQRDAPHGAAWVLLAVAVTFGNDTGAYFAGRALGRHKLYPASRPPRAWRARWGPLAGLIVMLVARAILAPG